MAHHNQYNIDLFYDIALRLTKEAGQIIQDNIFNRKKEVQTKTSATDFVTETDQKVEKFLIENISKQFPDHKFIGEESVAEGIKCNLTDDPTWIIDPIDGTTNFIHSFPHACISVGLFINKKPEIGIVFNPTLNQLFTARKGKGSYLNGEPIKVSGVKSLSESLVCMEYVGAGHPEMGAILQENTKFLMKNTHGLRTLGSAALDLAAIASGGVDAFFAYGIHIWDVGAGELLVTEAGGVMIDPSGGEVDRLSRRFLVASSQELAQTLAKNLKQYFPSERD